MSATNSLADESSQIADLFEFITLLLGKQQYREARQAINKNCELICRNWLVALEFAVLSQNCTLTRMITHHLHRTCDSQTHVKMFYKLLDLGRMSELGNTYSYSLFLSKSARCGLDPVHEHQLDSMKRTKSAILEFMQSKLKVCLLHEHEVPLRSSYAAA